MTNNIIENIELFLGFLHFFKGLKKIIDISSTFLHKINVFGGF